MYGIGAHDSSEHAPKLTISDIALMRQIIAWRKANGVDFVKREVYGAPYWARFGGAQVVFAQREEEMLGVSPGRKHLTFTWFAVSSFSQAVDVLVAFGYLPARFSTAYRDGWSAGYRVCDGFWDPEGRSLTQEQIGDVYPAVSW